MALTGSGTPWLLFLYAWSLVNVVATKNFTLPSTWQTTSNVSRESRESLAYSASATLSQGVNPLTGVTGQNKVLRPQDAGSFFAVLALEDYYSGNMSWRTQGTDTLKSHVQQSGLYNPSLYRPPYADPIYWGLTSFYSYRTYKDATLLDLAKEAYNVTYTGFITPSAAVRGSGVGRNVSFLPPANCTSSTFAGGVFTFQNVSDDTEISIWTVGPFMTLSAYLFEETNDTYYQQAVQLSLEFIINHMWNGTVVMDTFFPSTCDTVFKPFTVNQAWFIEGLSVWANVTENDSLFSFLEDVVANSTTFPGWTSSPDGILISGDSDIDNMGLLVRGLTEAFMRNPDTDLARYIRAFVNVQYNALSHAQMPGTNTSYYSQSWLHPSSSTFNAQGSIAAIDVLNSAANFAPVTSNPEPKPTPSNKSNTIGVIIGGVVGGVAAIAAVIAGLLLWRHRQHRQQGEGDIPVDPFLSRPTYAQVNRSKRYDGAPQASATSQLVPGTTPVPAVVSRVDGTDERHGRERDTIDTAELPTLVRRLNNLLSRSHPVEPPPQ